MKLNDIYTNLDKEINLKEFENFLAVVYDLEKSRDIDNIKEKLKKINLKKENNIYISKSKNIWIDALENKKLKKNINLKKIIKNSKKISYIILEKIENMHFNFKNKNRYFRYSAFIILFFSFLLIDKILIQSLVSSWIWNLYNIEYSKNITEVETHLSKAKTKFNIANILFIPFKIIPQQNIINANNWIWILQNISQLWLDWIEFYNKNLDFIKNKKINEIYFANLIENSKPFLEKSLIKINNINKNLDKIILKEKNTENSKKLEKLKKYLIFVENKGKYINNNFETFLNILWKNNRKKYLIVFQNNDEIRPTWGFMGSAWILEIFAWKIKSFKKRDIYAFEWDSKKNYKESVTPPTWINLLSERLWLRDSNAFINYQTSSKSINYFMKKAWYNLDWIIYINQKIILDILDKIWEINFWKYDTKITSKNFSEIISILVEAKISKKATLDTPKQALFDFSKSLKEKIIKTKKYPEILKVIINNFKSRDIVFYNFNKKENELIKKLEINWEFDYKKQTDFNYPFFISVWWNKSDRYMKRKYKKILKIQKNINNRLCSLKTNLEIVLENTFNKKDKDRIIIEMKKFRINPTKDLINIAWAWLNQNYTKVLIPENAIVNKKELSKYWYKILDHWKYKTVEKLLKTKSWNKSYFSINYKLENIDCNNFNYKIYKQAWIYNYNISMDYINNFYRETNTLKLDWLKEDFYYNK